MKIVLPPIYERKNDPDIDEEGDFFQRGGFSKNLTQLFRACDESLVISVDSRWGDGKTSFVMKWIAELECGAEFIPIYYDAYKNDFTGDAFLSIATAIHEKLKLIESSSSGATNRRQLGALKNSMAAVATDVLKLGAGIAITNLTGGAISGKDVSGRIGDAIGDLLAEGIKSRVDQKLKAHTEVQQHIDSYRGALQMALESSGNKKIIFFVDELDRCRPDFSIQVIEKIKHLFDVKGVFFVLSVNRQQLLSVITHVYGVSAEDAEVYFQKFIQLETKLPSISRAIERDEESLERFFLSALRAHEFDPRNITLGFDDLIELIGPRQLALNPRSIERVVTLAAIVLALSQDHSARCFYLLVFVSAAIKIGDPEFYYKYYTGRKFSSYNPSDIKVGRYYKNLAKIFGKVEGNTYEGRGFEASSLHEIIDLMEIFEFPEAPWAEEYSELEDK